MSNFIRLDRRKHESFLADHCVDPTTKELLKVGDEVCICANCKSPHLKSVWQSVKLCPSCRNESRKTLSKIPKTKSINNYRKRNTPNPIAKNSFKGYFIFFLITTVVGSIACFSFYTELEDWKNKYRSVSNEKNNLKSEISSMSNSVSQLLSYTDNIRKQLSESNEKLNQFNDLKAIASELNFTTGVKYKDRENYRISYSSNKAKIYFTVNYPIHFKSVKLDAARSGYITVSIYDNNNNRICEVYNGAITSGIKSLEFNCNLEKGSYYLTHSGLASLAYIENFNEYPISGNILKITRTQYDSKYYFNFFDWKYKLNIN